MWILKTMIVKDKGNISQYDQAETRIVKVIHAIESKGREATTRLSDGQGRRAVFRLRMNFFKTFTKLLHINDLR